MLMTSMRELGRVSIKRCTKRLPGSPCAQTNWQLNCVQIASFNGDHIPRDNHELKTLKSSDIVDHESRKVPASTPINTYPIAYPTIKALRLNM